MTALLEAESLTRHYAVSAGMFRPAATLKAVDGVAFDLTPGKTLAVVGESGSGKSTLARLVTLIEPPTSGDLTIAGVDVTAQTRAQARDLRKSVQMVFQDPFGSLNPRQKIGSILEEPLVINTSTPRAERRDQAHAMMAKVGLRPEHYTRYPHMFSGGQRQRIAIARVADEAFDFTTALPGTPRSSDELRAFAARALEQIRQWRATGA